MSILYGSSDCCAKIGFITSYGNLTDIAKCSSPAPAYLDLLLQEIEATPREYWADLLDTLRQFREKIPSTAPSLIDSEQAQKNQAAIDLLDSWLHDTEDA
ncbi:MAG: hypothetical protein ACKN87_07865 [Microcystis aeruginosa]